MNRCAKGLPHHLAILLALLVLTDHASANQFFQDCSQVIDKPEFRALKRHLNSRQGMPQPDMCFRLNNHQFLVTVTDKGMASVQIIFPVTEQNCETLHQKTYNKIFALSDRVFKEADNRLKDPAAQPRLSPDVHRGAAPPAGQRRVVGTRGQTDG